MTFFRYSHKARIARRGLRTLCLAFLVVFMGRDAVSMGDDGKLPLEAPVRAFPTAVAAPAQPMVRTSARPAPAPSTPAAKLPQYQLSPRQNDRRKVDDVLNPRVRFFLNLPNDTLLVEATISIDGSPFAMPRRKRVERILKEAKVGKDIETGTAVVTEKDQPAVVTPKIETITDATLPDRLRHTMKLTGEAPTVEEVDWLVSNWIDGPTIMQLNDNFQRFRANQRPEFVILDRNRDGKISPEELQQANKSFWECDLNQDEIVQFVELAVAATDPRPKAIEIESRDLIVFLPDETTAADAYRRLIPASSAGKDNPPIADRRFDQNANGQFDADELDSLRKMPADLSLSVTFNSSNAEKSRIALTAVTAELRESIERMSVDTTGIVLTVKGTPVILTAAQAQPNDQISIGAVNDGYPFLPSLDQNDDGRLTVRELRGLRDALKAFDRNQDGALTLDEARSPIRVCIGLGASVHRELVGIRSVHRKATAPSVSGPEWFVRMDRNKDNDLTRGEFPGTDEQFKALDADGDELVSAQEALEFDRTEETEKKGAAAPGLKPDATTTIDFTTKKRTDRDEPN